MLISTNVASLRSISVRCEYQGQLDLDLMRRAQQALVKLERLSVSCASFGVRALKYLSSWSQLSHLQLNASYDGRVLTHEHALAFGSLPFLRRLRLVVKNPNAECPWVLSTVLENVPTQIDFLELSCFGIETQHRQRWETFGKKCVRIMNRRFEGNCPDFRMSGDFFQVELSYDQSITVVDERMTVVHLG